MIYSRPTSAPQPNKQSLQRRRFRLLTARGLGWPVLAGILIWLVTFRANVQAHPLDEFYQVTYLIVAPDQITLKIELYPGVLVAPQLLALVDTDRNDDISTAEARTYISRFIDDLTFQINDQAIPLRAANLDFPPVLGIRAGQAIIRFDLQAELPDDFGETYRLYYQNNHQPDIAVYVVNAMVDNPNLVHITGQERDVFQSTIRLDYTINSGPTAGREVGASPSEIEPPGSISSGQEQLNRYLYESQLSPFFLAVALSLAVALGGLHALTPGHGKTLVAAYLIGSRGTVSHAIALGGIVTFTHTASVIVIGLLALLASHYVLPNVLAPALEIISGLLVLYLGGRLLWDRWGTYKRGKVRHDHQHAPDDHEYHHHHRHHSLPEQVKLSDLLTLGISGGLVPCPEALGIMFIAIGLNRISFGLGLVVAFSFGLALILIIIGVLLVRSKSWLDRRGNYGESWQPLLPLASALMVTLLGLGMVAKGLMPYVL